MMDNYITATAAIIITLIYNGHRERLDVLLWLYVYILFQLDSLLLHIILCHKWLTGA